MKLIKVHKDVRGEMYILEIEGKEHCLSVNKKGAMRGGEFHSVKQYNLVLKGNVKIFEKINGDEKITELDEGGTYVIDEKIPHLLEYLEEGTVMVNWCNEEKDHFLVEDYRAKVDESIKRLESSKNE